MKRGTLWLFGLAAALLAALVFLFGIAKPASDLIHEAMLPSCVHRERTPDYVLCYDWWHQAVMTIVEQLGMFVSAGVFIATFMLIAPARTKGTTLFCCGIGVALGLYAAIDSQDARFAVSSILVNGAVAFWAFRRYAIARVA